MVIYCKSVHFHGFEDARKNLGFYEMSSFKEGKAMNLAEDSGKEISLSIFNCCLESRFTMQRYSYLFWTFHTFFSVRNTILQFWFTQFYVRATQKGTRFVFVPCLALFTLMALNKIQFYQFATQFVHLRSSLILSQSKGLKIFYGDHHIETW